MKHMREFLLIVITTLLATNTAFAFDLIYPKEKKMIVNSNHALIMGKAKKSESITINDAKIYIAPNGAFTHSVKLKNGENRIVIKSSLYNNQIYRLYKNTPNSANEVTINEFEPKTFRVISDNTPLRSTPIDYGMNRIAHLFKDTNLIVDAEKGKFYRVKLSKTQNGWIAKNAVEESLFMEELPQFITMNSKTYKNASEHIIEFTGKLPYTVEEQTDEIIFRVYNPFISDSSVYTVNIRKPEKYYYKLFLSNGVYYLKVNELPNCENATLEGQTIVIDAGHGGSEKGAIGCLGDKEKDINLAVATELKNRLSLMGANVIMTRECDANISLDERVAIAKNNCANIFISIHLNSIPDTEFHLHKHKGTSVYYYNDNSKSLAKYIKDAVTKGLGTRDDGVKTASFAVIRPTEYIGVLVELAYMINPTDVLLYKKEDFPQEAAKAIADGILNFVSNK